MPGPLTAQRPAALRPATTNRSETLGQSAIEQCVVKERLRSDRRGIPFATLEFRLLSTKTRVGHQRRKLIRLVQQRMRLTDQLGRLDDDRLLLLLPDTDRRGAVRLRDEIFALVQPTGFRLDARIAVYPPDHQTDGARQWPGIGTSSLRNHWRQVRPQSYGTEGTILCASMPAWKRAMDITVAVVMLVALAPLLVAVAVAIKLTSRGPVLFRQWRDGQGGRPFIIYKFRTMRVSAEAEQDQLRVLNQQDGPAFKIDRDPRVTKIGRFLRVSCIDELPQLFNVLRGQMSLVGPRPLPCTESRQIQSWQARRLSVRPGLTCYWQALRTTEVSFTDWMRLDLRYVNHVRFTTDLTLIGKTVAAILGFKQAPQTR